MQAFLCVPRALLVDVVLVLVDNVGDQQELWFVSCHVAHDLDCLRRYFLEFERIMQSDVRSHTLQARKDCLGGHIPDRRSRFG